MPDPESDAAVAPTVVAGREAFGRRLRALRADLTQDELARAAGMGAVYYSKIETGRHSTSLDKILNLAHALEVPVAELFVPGPAPRPLAARRAAVGRRVRLIRAERTPTEVARAAGMDEVHYAAVEAGAQDVSLDAILAVADALGVPAAELLVPAPPDPEPSVVAAEREVFGRRLRSLRAQRRQSDVAQAAGIDRAYYLGVEAGRRNPSLDTILAVADALGVGAADLFVEVSDEA
ncbi:helix-turn-helix domain-containing protein [Embleya sp. NPDC008237]|uniref:helix-turn-helix domain-containing protein n=1 Tax=Embleya sp. NPDC008237 TaxID=3363978 RepID=UPI0036EB3A7C